MYLVGISISLCAHLWTSLLGRSSQTNLVQVGTRKLHTFQTMALKHMSKQITGKEARAARAHTGRWAAPDFCPHHEIHPRRLLQVLFGLLMFLPAASKDFFLSLADAEQLLPGLTKHTSRVQVCENSYFGV